MRRPAGWPEAAPLEVELAGLLRRERTGGGWTQSRLARAIGISQSQLCRYEIHTALRPRIDVYARAFHVLGIAIRLDAHRLHEVPRRDRGHAFVLAYVLRRLPRDWLSDTEVMVQERGRHGWIDLLLFDARSHVLLVVEVKTEIHDSGEILRRLRWHAKQALPAAYARGWRPRTVIPVLVVVATGDAIGRLIEARRLFTSALPRQPRELLSLLNGEENLGRRTGDVQGCICVVDPRSKRRDWLVPIPRVRPARVRWAGYSDFVRDIEGRRIRRSVSRR